MTNDRILDSRLRAAIRRHFSVSNQCVPIEVLDHIDLPKPNGVEGDPGGWFTRGGTPIHSPNAYAKSGWSNMTYLTDGRIITITLAWLANFIRKNRPYTT